MAFDWITFLNSRGIPYQDRGPNISRGNIALRCPLCVDDPSMHMSLSLTGRGWRCWRNHSHKGKSDARLVMSLIHCTWEVAANLTGRTFTTIPTNFLETVRGRLSTNDDDTPNVALKNPFKRIGFTPSARPFTNYLRGRGLTDYEIGKLSDRYGVYYCTAGAYKNRLIFTLLHQGKLLSWTGRGIFKQMMPRYKALTTDPDKAHTEGLTPAPVRLTDYLLWIDDLFLNTEDADTICLCEGPFDALKIRILGRKEGVTATCFFTSEPSDSQLDQLYELLPAYKRRYLVLDRNTTGTGMMLESQLSALSVKRLELPRGIKDPGLLNSTDQLLRIVS